MAKTCNFQNPISPKWGPIPPIKNCFSQGLTKNNMHGSHWGPDPPKGVNVKSRPKYQAKEAI